MNSKNIFILFISLLAIITATNLLIYFNEKKADYQPPIFVSKSEDHNKLINQADQKYKENKLTEALNIYRKVLFYYPNNNKLLGRIAEIRLRLKDFEKASVAYTKLTKIEPDESLNWVNLAIAELYLGKLPEAQKAAQQAVAIKTDDYRANFVLAAVAASEKDIKTTLLELNKIQLPKALLKFMDEPVFDKIRNEEEFVNFRKAVEPEPKKEGKNEQN